METRDYLNTFYQNIDEDSRLTTRYGMVEYLTTMRYIQKYLQPNSRILEIGAATGRYSHALAREGYQVDAVELLEHNIEIFRRNTLPEEPVTVTQGNATDLHPFPDNAYDLTLLLGPMYHLFTEEDKLQALSEAIRVTKPGGVIFAAYCMADPTVLTYGFIRGEIHNIMEKCMVDPTTFKAFSHPWDIFELHRKEDIDALRNRFPVTRLHFVASDGYAQHMRQTMEAMNDETFQLYLNYHFATCERPDMIGLSHHTLDIFRKDSP